MALSFKAEVAKRENVYTKIFMSGLSGSGKSYSALRLASGMADEIEHTSGTRPEIIVLNTEGTRGCYYAKEFHYKVYPPQNMNVKQEEFTTQFFIDWTEYNIKEETVNGVPPIIIYDTFTPAWDSLKAQQAKMGGNFQAWARATPLWNNIKRMIVEANAHMIVLARSKAKFDIDTDSSGKKTIKKFGLEPEMRDGFDYEFTIAFNIESQTHAAFVDKDNTHIFGNRVTDVMLTERDGAEIIKWANSDGAQNPQPPMSATPAVETTKIEAVSNPADNVVEKPIKEYIADIKRKVDDLMASCADENTQSVMRSTVADTIRPLVVNSAGKNVADYRVIKDSAVAVQVLEALNNI